MKTFPAVPKRLFRDAVVAVEEAVTRTGGVERTTSTFKRLAKVDRPAKVLFDNQRSSNLSALDIQRRLGDRDARGAKLTARTVFI